MDRNKYLSVGTSVLISLLIISGAVAFVTFFKPFYYWHIEWLDLPARVGFSAEQIQQAYTEVIDYMTGFSPVFSAGVFEFSESGAAHFLDVRKLFILDLWCAVVCAVALVVIYFAAKRKNIRFYRFKNHGPLFCGPVILLSSFLVIAGLASLDFDTAFTVFHKIFFPGKDNWVFSPKTDPIIKVLPQQFFMDCAILIFAIVLLCCVICILIDNKHKEK